jgi:hypothetical protein
VPPRQLCPCGTRSNGRAACERMPLQRSRRCLPVETLGPPRVIRYVRVTGVGTRALKGTMCSPNGVVIKDAFIRDGFAGTIKGVPQGLDVDHGHGVNRYHDRVNRKRIGTREMEITCFTEHRCSGQSIDTSMGPFCPNVAVRPSGPVQVFSCPNTVAFPASVPVGGSRLSTRDSRAPRIGCKTATLAG